MAYTARDLIRIKLGICLECGEASVGRYRKCLRCRRGRARGKQSPRYFKRRRGERETDRAAGRGYWPDIHGEV